MRSHWRHRWRPFRRLPGSPGAIAGARPDRAAGGVQHQPAYSVGRRRLCGKQASSPSPDVFWRQEPANYLPYTDEGRARRRALWAELDTDQFARDLGDMVTVLRGDRDCTGKIGVMGFCLGGKFTYLASTRLPIDAAVSYYGVQIDQHPTKPIAALARS